MEGRGELYGLSGGSVRGKAVGSKGLALTVPSAMRSGAISNGAEAGVAGCVLLNHPDKVNIGHVAGIDSHSEGRIFNMSFTEHLTIPKI